MSNLQYTEQEFAYITKAIKGAFQRIEGLRASNISAAIGEREGSRKQAIYSNRADAYANCLDILRQEIANLFFAPCVNNNENR